MSDIQFLYGDRELLLGVMDPTSVSVEVIACNTSSQLEARNSVARTIHQRAGTPLHRERTQLLKEYGDIAPGMAVYTSAGDLSYQAVIHAVGSGAEYDPTGSALARSVTNSLLLCETNGWTSIAFALLGAEQDQEITTRYAHALHHAITHFWDARMDSAVMKIILCLAENSFTEFVIAFRAAALAPENDSAIRQAPQPTDDTEIGLLDLSADNSSDSDDAIQDWFKS